MKTIADLLLARCTGIPKNFAKANGLPYEEFRHVLRDGHVPSDKTLLLYAERLGLDPALLILTAYWQKAPECAKEYIGLSLVRRDYELSNRDRI